jgi:cardiolipin synthase A/B
MAGTATNTTDNPRAAGTMSKDKLVSREGDTVRLETSVFFMLLALVVVLAVLLWSAQRGRKVHLTFTEIDSLREALPSIAGATQSVLLDGNKIELLQNGDGFFPPLLAAIGAAKETVHLETYVWWEGKICEQVADALAAKAKEAVEVRVLLDASGSSRMDDKLLERMRDAGVKVSKYRPARLSNLARVNSRDHRKIAVLDGKIGFVFGHGIGDEWVGNAEDRHHWRDTAARLEGPIVGPLQSAFTENWVEETGEVLVGSRFFPRLQEAGTSRAHLAYHFNHGSVSAVDLLYRIAFVSAHQELWIQNPYLAPDPEVLELIAQAAERGADVRLMLPGEVTDSQIVRHAGHHHFTSLLRRGVRIFEYQRTLNHQKVMIVDGLWSHIGSTNLDNRSFESNDEVSLGIIDTAIASQLRDAFLADQQHCREIVLKDWLDEPWSHRVRDALAWRLNELL